MKRLIVPLAVALVVTAVTVVGGGLTLDMKYGSGTTEFFASLGYDLLANHVPVLPDIPAKAAPYALAGAVFVVALLVILLRLYKPVWWLLEGAAGCVFGFFVTPWSLSENIAEDAPKTDENAKPEEKMKMKWITFWTGGLLGVLCSFVATSGSIVASGVAGAELLTSWTPPNDFPLKDVPHWLCMAWTGFVALSITIGVLRGRAAKRKRLAEEAAKDMTAVPPTEAELEVLGLKEDAKPKPAEKNEALGPGHAGYFVAEDYFAEDRRVANERLKKLLEELAATPKSSRQRFDDEWSAINDLTTVGSYITTAELERRLEEYRERGWMRAARLAGERLGGRKHYPPLSRKDNPYL